MSTVQGWNGVEQRICSIPHRHIWACLPGPETEKKPHAGRRLSTRQETQDHRGGRRLLRPSTHTRSKYHQPHRSGRQSIKHRDAGTWHRPSVSHTGGRRVTTGAPGGRTEKQQTDGEEERGGVRDTHAGKLVVDKDLGGNLGGGREGGTITISGRGSVTHNPN